MVPQSPDMEIVAFSEFPAPVGSPEGYGIFLRVGAYSMQVGSILPYGSNEVMLNVNIMEEMEIPGYETCAMWQVYATVADATVAARLFLASNVKP